MISIQILCYNIEFNMNLQILYIYIIYYTVPLPTDVTYVLSLNAFLYKVDQSYSLGTPPTNLRDNSCCEVPSGLHV